MSQDSKNTDGMQTCMVVPDDPSQSALEMISRLPDVTNDVVVMKDVKVAMRADFEEYKKGKVALISGGGSGHEPAHAGYVGKGMLTAAVAGNCFASPSVSAILTAILTVSGPAGCLLIVKSYTGDRFNFNFAAAKAQARGIPCKVVTVADDVALPCPKGSSGILQRRGLAGTLFLHKILGSLAEGGADLDTIEKEAQKIAAQIGTIGVSFAPVLVPGNEAGPAFAKRLEAEVIELGMGIHGESGARRIPRSQLRCTAGSSGDHCLDMSRLVDVMLREGLFNDNEGFRYLSQRKKGQRCVLLTNNLGGTSNLEMTLIAGEAAEQLEKKYGLLVTRTVTGSLMTSLNMPGFSLSLLLLEDGATGDAWVESLDAPSAAAAWPGTGRRASGEGLVSIPPDVQEVLKPFSEPPLTAEEKQSEGVKRAERLLRAACGVLIAKESEISAMDAVCGDGDCGIGLKRGAETVLAGLEEGSLPLRSGGLDTAFWSEVGRRFNEGCEGSSGVLYGIFLEKIGERLAAAAAAGGDAKAVASAVKAAVSGLEAVCLASKGSRTMMDALIPSAAALEEAVKGGAGGRDALMAAAEAAAKGCESTKELRPAAGRSAYIPFDQVRGTADPGAYAVSLWVAALASAFD
uniref:DhaK domain-containing protein n=1 Tax=Chromera velia CCMP2878 TaxID=1169474 RepID=A0A0G4FKX8_9ALVE|eukprot:Cvel_17547.t1-p1 / transcript=Cvel_17547.t1 / gene=Cvel_17547 / organism=Chromera_velia_CCMP2878 / gene_product=Putative 3,4-dihydroxy-2-butanone kinase, putative / transcript_product=Putative 3,4-dihydroxy-2-butanone kinase, putative / location=Cvel_scaffold1408:43004-45175(-) / protein_length=630 / sequence_SO=supercontig / SO=protein_coding / is_pseudo=false